MVYKSIRACSFNERTIFILHAIVLSGNKAFIDEKVSGKAVKSLCRDIAVLKNKFLLTVSFKSVTRIINFKKICNRPW